MSNIVIIGNGFDRQLGLKTDYISFLDWVENKGEYFEETMLKGAGFFKDWLLETNHLIEENWIEWFMDIIINHGIVINGADAFLNKIYQAFKHRDESGNVVYAKKMEHLIRYLLPLTNKRIFTINSAKSNLWFNYFNYLRKSKSNNDIHFLFKNLIDSKGQWIDLETLIEENIKQKLNHVNFIGNDLNIYSFSKFMLDSEYNESKIDEKLWQDFKDIKILLTEYIKEQEIIFANAFAKNKKPYVFDWLNDVSAFYVNFNYSNVFNILSTIKSNAFPLKHWQLYHVHGQCSDGSDIVFGLDSFFVKEDISKQGKSDLEIKLLEDKELVKYTKIQQLLSLQKEKTAIPSFRNIDTLTIFGHSIGEQDYNYFFSILDTNIDAIRIVYNWYIYNDGSGNNKQSGQDALFKMINAYEKYANKRIFHKMIFEGRIKFTKGTIPKIVQ